MGYGTIENESDKKILDCVDRLKDRFISSVQELVRIDSVEREACDGAPFGNGVKHALECALDISGQLGFDTVNLDHYMGYAQYGMGDDYVCAIGHVDVVPAGEGWRQPPFNGYLENGVIYSRGVLDNKGPIMACLFGLAAIKEAGLALKNPVRIIFGCDEESGFEDLKYYLSKERPPLYGFTPDCKYPVVYSERGRAVVRITGCMDQLETFFEFVNKYFIGARNTGDRLGIDVTLSYPGGVTIEELIKRICTRAGAEGLKVELIQNYDPVVFPKDTPMVKAMQESYELVTGQDGTPVTTTGGTYAKAMPGIVPFGPSFPGQKGISHNPNEWMSVEDLMTNAKIYALALYRLGQL